MAVSTLQNITPKFKDFTNVTTDSNGFVNTGLYFVPVLGNIVKGDKKFYPKYTDTYSDKAQFV